MAKTAPYQFPAWADKPRSKAERASFRLKYMLNRLAIETNHSCTLGALAVGAGMSKSLMSNYISRGALSVGLAERLQKKYGPELAPASLLIDPLSA